MRPLAKLHSTYQLVVQYLRCQYVGHNEAKNTLKSDLNFCMLKFFLGGRNVGVSGVDEVMVVVIVIDGYLW